MVCLVSLFAMSSLIYFSVCLSSKFQQIAPPLFTDLEGKLLAAHWTSNAMRCALRCSMNTKCASFLYQENRACYSEVSHLQYIGYHRTTFTGKTCQPWASQSPHQHRFNDADFPDISMSAANNYCRDPDKKGFLWCYTTDPSQTWEPCYIPQCDQEFSDGNCRSVFYTTKYTGLVNQTNTGLTCQRWDRQTPHTHAYVIEWFFVDGSASAAENYCRDINYGYLVRHVLFCITNDSDVFGEACDIKSCSDIIPLERCYDSDDHYGYTGTWSQTITGLPCQRWDSQSPHSHSNNITSLFPDATVTEAANYCRDPDRTGFLWCYTTNKTIPWQPCGISQCTNHIPCRTYTNTKYYAGAWSRTYSGKTCQAWSSQSPHSHEYGDSSLFYPEREVRSAGNFCRDPNESGKLWCYTTDPSTQSEPCDIPICEIEKGNCKLYNYTAASADPPGIRVGFHYYIQED